MAAGVESMFSVREKPWHGLGVIIEEAVCSKEALHLAGLDWSVRQERLVYSGKDSDYVMNIRSSDDKVLGVVGNRYVPVQNEDAFAFTDELLGHNVVYETAGSLWGGRRVWLLARMPDIKIFDDVIEPYMCLNNIHDGGGSMKVCMTPVRVVCQNTLNMALKSAKRTWTMHHVGKIENKLADAAQVLGLASSYMRSFEKEAEELYQIKISPEKFTEFSETLFPVEDGMTPRKEESQILLQSQLGATWDVDDLGNIRGTGWGFMNAISDMSTHKPPLRKSDTYQENMFIVTIDMPTLLDKAHSLVRAIS